MTGHWNKLGRILSPTGNGWLVSHAGPSFALPISDRHVWIYVSGRDDRNRSRIGRFLFDIKRREVVEFQPEPVLELGERGAFDANGTSYPWIIQRDQDLLMYYTGWLPAVVTPFANDLGVARSTDGGATFHRISRAPVLPRSDSEPFGTGSVCVYRNSTEWQMLYTSFGGWGSHSEEPPRHEYLIKTASSQDGIEWERHNKVAIGFQNATEYAIAKPSLLMSDDMYHLWYTYRGERYRIGYATSSDGTEWARHDTHSIVPYVSESGWDSEMICYPHVFRCGESVYLLYNGNEYGRTGLGLAFLEDN